MVGGSSPFAGSTKSALLKLKKSVGEMAERSMAADCKSAGVRLRRFESFSPHVTRVEFNGRTPAFQAGYVSSILITRSSERLRSSVGRALPW